MIMLINFVCVSSTGSEDVLMSSIAMLHPSPSFNAWCAIKYFIFSIYSLLQ